MRRRRTIIGIRGALAAAAAVSLPVLAQPLHARATSSVPAQSAAMQPTAGQGSAFQADAIWATAVRALRWAFYAPNGYRWEYSGILIRRNGELGYSEFPRTLKKVDAVEMDPSKQKAPGDMLVALYHTHPCKPREYFPQYFSPQDLISAFFWHVPTFILDECTGDVHEFDPAIDQARDTGVIVEIKTKSGRSRRVRLPAGRIVGNIGDRGPDLSLIESLMQRTLY
ncbi:MAG: hypothetical protein ACREUT_03615 [Steroidobacteraceae bacterium]